MAIALQAISPAPPMVVVDERAVTRRLGPGMTAYLFDGASVGIRQTGARPLSLIIAYPLKEHLPAR